MFRLTKKKFLLGAATVCLMAIAAGAYAYFTAPSGSGTGTATVGSSQAVVLHGTTSGNLYPGSTATVNFTVDNPSKAAQQVTTISLSSIAADAGHSGCVTTVGSETSKPFYMAPVSVNQTFGPGTTGVAVTATGTLQMRDTGLNQDNCQGANLTLTLASP